MVLAGKRGNIKGDEQVSQWLVGLVVRTLHLLAQRVGPRMIALKNSLAHRG
jgi:hypothetical protein